MPYYARLIQKGVIMKHVSLLAAAGLLALGACDPATDTAPTEPAPVEATETASTTIETPEPLESQTVASDVVLSAILEQQPEKVRARYAARNPAETLAFFGIEPGMTVAEALPGGGWYTKILVPYLGSEGKLIGAHYPDALWPQFGWDEERVQARIEGSNNWVASTADWGVSGAAISDYKLTEAGADLDGSLDAILFIRALHNLNRFEFTEPTIAESYRLLKPGGIVGVVQHSGPEGNPDEWANGSAGYLKQSYVVSSFEAAGFEFVGSSDVNANAADVPTAEDFVWRLPPSLATTEEGTPEQDALKAIGESNRMTLKFKKPA